MLVVCVLHILSAHLSHMMEPRSRFRVKIIQHKSKSASNPADFFIFALVPLRYQAAGFVETLSSSQEAIKLNPICETQQLTVTEPLYRLHRTLKQGSPKGFSDSTSYGPFKCKYKPENRRLAASWSCQSTTLPIMTPLCN